MRIHVTVPLDVVLRHAMELGDERPGEERWERQARTLDELGYQVVLKSDDEDMDTLPADFGAPERTPGVCRLDGDDFALFNALPAKLGGARFLGGRTREARATRRALAAVHDALVERRPS